MRRDPARWRDLVRYARSFPGRERAALLAGVMDAAEVLSPKAQAEALEVGLSSGASTVRLAALPAYAQLAGIEEARKRALADPAGKVWALAAKQQESGGEPATGERASRDRGGQGSLFEEPGHEQ